MADEHYLKNELYTLLREDATLFEFLQAGALDGIWYWDVEKPEHEWLSPRFWETFGYDPSEKAHRASEWQDMIHPEDLKTALANFEGHCNDPNHPYDQLVRYTHKDGSTVWVRCRGLCIRDASGKVVRMLGAHNDVTALKRAERTLARKNNELAEFNELAIGREERMIELKREVNALSRELGRPSRYDLGFVDGE